MDDYTFRSPKHRDDHYGGSKVICSAPPGILSKIILTQKNRDYETFNSKDFLLEPVDILSSQGILNEKTTADETGVKFEKEPEFSSEDTNSVHQEYRITDLIGGINDGMRDKVPSKESCDCRIRSCQVQLIRVVGAGNQAVNGVYRWFTKHKRFIMFTDDCQYQIVGGVNLSEYGDCYKNCCVIQEVMENVVQLYAAASKEDSSISFDGWICICGTSPAPKIQVGEEWGFYEVEGGISTEGSDTSISLLDTSLLLKQWAISNFDSVKELQ